MLQIWSLRQGRKWRAGQPGRDPVNWNALALALALAWHCLRCRPPHSVTLMQAKQCSAVQCKAKHACMCASLAWSIDRALLIRHNSMAVHSHARCCSGWQRAMPHACQRMRPNFPGSARARGRPGPPPPAGRLLCVLARRPSSRCERRTEERRLLPCP